MVLDTQLGRASEDGIVVKYRRICLPLLGRPMVNAAPTGSWALGSVQTETSLSYRAHGRCSRRVVNSTNGQPCNTADTPASSTETGDDSITASSNDRRGRCCCEARGWRRWRLERGKRATQC